MLGRTHVAVTFLVAAGMIGCAQRTGGDAGRFGSADRADASTEPVPTSAGSTLHTASLALEATGTGAWGGTNSRQRFSTRIDAHGASISDLASRWNGQLHVTRVGRTSQMRQADDATPTAHGSRVQIVRGGGVTEWFIHDVGGLEQGIDLAERPAGSGPLEIDVAVDGLVAARTRRGVELRRPDGVPVLLYGRLSATDADGRSIDSRLIVDEGRVSIEIDDDSARYPIAVDPLVWAQDAVITPTDSATVTRFGSSVELDGDTLAVSGYTSLGWAVYVFERSAGVWAQTAKLTPASTEAFGDLSLRNSISLSGSTLVVGAPAHGFAGGAYVFVNTSGTWGLQTVLTSTNTTAASHLGTSVSVSGDQAILGAPNESASFSLGGGPLGGGGATVANAGSAIIFTRSGSTWAEAAKLSDLSEYTSTTSTPSSGEGFGTLVAIGPAIACEIGNDKQSPVSKVYSKCYQGSGASWGYVAWSGYQSPTYPIRISSTTVANLYSVQSLAGGTFSGSYIGTSTGWICGASSTRVAAYNNNNVSPVWELSGTTWSQTGTLTASDAAALVTACDLSESTVALGAPADGATGKVFVFDDGIVDGATCSTGASCGSGVCTEGVCCDATCSGPCKSCLGSKTGGASGTCGFVTSVSLCGPCSADIDCPTGAYCAGSKCTVKAATGATCSGNNACASGFCVDGVCCESACTATCYACSAKKSGAADGKCAPIPDATDPDKECPGGSSCVGSAVTKHVCNGAGACRATTQSCAPFICKADGSDCNVTCTVDADCGDASYYCGSDMTCQQKQARGKTCTANDQCVSGSCADGVCCDSSCTGACQACAEPGNEGTCTPVKGAPRTGHPTCLNSGTTCGGFCDGSKAFDCSFLGSATTCAGGCTNSAISTCDGAGSCGAAAACPGNFACADATSCKSTCVADTDCAGGYSCKSGACSAASAKCSADGSTSTSANGVPQSCSPYTCGSNGSCQQSCATTNDCTTSFTCDQSKSPGQCVATPRTDGGGGGGGCGVAARGANPSRVADFALWLVVLSAVMGRRCRA